MKHAAEKIVAVRSRLVKSWAKLRSEDFPSPVQVRWHQKRRRSRLRRAFPGAARLRGSLLPACRWTVPGGDEVTPRQTATSLPRGGAVPGTPGRGGRRRGAAALPEAGAGNAEIYYANAQFRAVSRSLGMTPLKVVLLL